MKIAMLSIPKFATAILVGVILSIAIGSVMAPHPVAPQPNTITPVPTPEHVVAHDTPNYAATWDTQTWENERASGGISLIEVFPLIILGGAIITIFLPLLAYRDL